MGQGALNLRNGGVIGLIVRNHDAAFYGVILDLELGGQHKVTREAMWKRVERLKREREHLHCFGRQTIKFMRVGHIGAATRPEGLVGEARKFPYHFGARYIWAKGVEVRGIVFL